MIGTTLRTFSDSVQNDARGMRFDTPLILGTASDLSAEDEYTDDLLLPESQVSEEGSNLIVLSKAKHDNYRWLMNTGAASKQYAVTQDTIHGASADFAHIIPTKRTDVRFISDLVAQLERLQNGWDGPDSLAPSEQIVADIKASIASLTELRCPIAEVDQEGIVVLEWTAQGKALRLTFYGDRYVVGTLSPKDCSYPSWRLPVNEPRKIRSEIEKKAIRDFL